MIEAKLDQALTDLGKGVRTRSHNRRKRTEGVAITPRPRPTPTPRDPYHRDQSQIDEYRQGPHRRMFPDD